MRACIQLEYVFTYSPFSLSMVNTGVPVFGSIILLLGQDKLWALPLLDAPLSGAELGLNLQ